MSTGQRSFLAEALRACELRADFPRGSLETLVWRRVSNRDYRGQRNSLKNHAFRLAPDDITWISICGAFSVLNVSMVPESPKAATCAACEAGLAENLEEQECS